MRMTVIAFAALLTVGCGAKKDSGGGSGSGSGGGSATAVCPGGSLAGKDGTCVVVITPAKVAILQAQQTRIDELGGALDKLDVVSAPIELLDGIRQLEQWKTLAEHSDKLKVVDTVVATLSDAVKQLRAFRGNLTEVSQRLGHLRAELDKLIAGTGMAKNLDDARAQISTEVRALITPYAQQTSDTIQRAVTPLVVQLSDVADLVGGACAMAKLSGGGDKLKELCGNARDTFTQAITFVDGIKVRPAAVFQAVTDQLVGQLDVLIDDGTRTAIAAAQKQVNQALLVPMATDSGSGSGSGR